MYHQCSQLTPAPFCETCGGLDQLRIAPLASSMDITPRDGPIGDSYDHQEGPEPHRQARGEPGGHARDYAWHEPGKSWRCPSSDLRASPKIRKGHEPYRREPHSA